MKKINKTISIALIFTLVGVFLWQEVACASHMSYLRVPIGSSERMAEVLTSKSGSRKKQIPDYFHSVTQYGLLHHEYVMYDRAVKMAINPDDEELIGAYGCSGADVSNVFISTNAGKVYFIDQKAVSLDKLRHYWQQNMSTLDKSFSYGPGKYLSGKYEKGFSIVDNIEGDDLDIAIIMELKAMGVTDEDMVSIDQDEDGNIKINFNWAYNQGEPKRLRTIIFIEGDITKPSKGLTEKMTGKIDFYYQKAGLSVPQKYGEFIEIVAQWLKPKGVMITDGYDDNNGYYDPGRWLDGRDDFKPIEPTDNMRIWGKEILALREDYTGVEDSFYGWHVSLRQKLIAAQELDLIDRLSGNDTKEIDKPADTSLLKSLAHLVISGDINEIKLKGLTLPDDFSDQVVRSSYYLEHITAFTIAKLLGRKPAPGVIAYAPVTDYHFKAAIAYILSAILFTSENPHHLYTELFTIFNSAIDNSIKIGGLMKRWDQAKKGEIFLLRPFSDLKEFIDIVDSETEAGLHFYPNPSKWDGAYCRDEFVVRVIDGTLHLVIFGSYDEFYREKSVREELKGAEAEKKLREIGFIGGDGIVGLVKGGDSGVGEDLLPLVAYTGHSHPKAISPDSDSIPSMRDFTNLESTRNFYIKLSDSSKLGQVMDENALGHPNILRKKGSKITPIKSIKRSRESL